MLQNKNRKKLFIHTHCISRVSIEDNFYYSAYKSDYVPKMLKAMAVKRSFSSPMQQTLKY